MNWLPDTNVWLALVEPYHAQHATARAWFAGLQPPDTVFMCRATQQSLLRL